MSPDDVTAWLAGWVGIVADDNWQPEQLAAPRRPVPSSCYRWRGTVKGMADLIEAYTGLRPEVEDNGGVAVSTTARERRRPAAIDADRGRRGVPRQALG